MVEGLNDKGLFLLRNCRPNLLLPLHDGGVRAQLATITIHYMERGLTFAEMNDGGRGAIEQSAQFRGQSPQ
jgi:hypothetical protein